MKDLDLEYLKHIISISIPICNSKGLTEAYITFPIAACWRKGVDMPMLCYSCQYGDHTGETIGTSEPNELLEVENAIRNYIASKKDTLSDEPHEVNLEIIIGRGSALPTQFPQSLRAIKALFKKTSKEMVFYVFLSCQPVGKTCALSASCQGSQKGCWRSTIKAFRKSFLSTRVRGSLDLMLNSLEKATVSSSKVTSQNGPKFSSLISYPLLRDLLSNIQEIAIKLLKPPGQFTFDEDRRRAFSVVFVIPHLTNDNKLSFKYVLTHDQIQLLRSCSHDPDIRGKFEQSLREKRKNAFRELLDGIVEDIGPDQKASNSQDLRKVIRRLSEIFRNHANECAERQKKKGRIEESLRTAIILDYAFRDWTRTKLLEQPDLAMYMDTVNINYGQAFLLDQIFIAKRPDVMFSMVNHPFSKYRQFPTERLIEAYEEDYNDDLLYPPGLHLLESFFLHPPLFLYPIYRYNSPLLLCAFDAVLYSGHWQALKSMVDMHTDGIFSAIISYELEKTKQVFAESSNFRSLNSTGAVEELKKHLGPLFLRFCSNIEKHFYQKPFSFQVADNMGAEEIGIKLVGGQEVYLEIPQFKKILVAQAGIVTESHDGRSLFARYLKSYSDSFDSIWKINELSAREEAHTWAHATTGELNAIRSMFERFKRGLPNEYQHAFALPERHLAIANSNMYALMQIRMLQRERDSLFKGGGKVPRQDLCRVITQAFMIALLRELTDDLKAYEESRTKLLKPEYISEGAFKNIDDYLLRFEKWDHIQLSDIELMLKTYFRPELKIEIQKCTFADGLKILKGDYESLLRYAFMEIFFNIFKYVDFSNPALLIDIDGKQAVNRDGRWVSDEFLCSGEDEDHVTLLRFSNSKGDVQAGGAQIGGAFLADIARIAAEGYSGAELVCHNHNMVEVRFPVMVYRSF